MHPDKASEAAAGLSKPGRRDDPLPPRTDRAREYELSAGQRRLWFLDRMHPGLTAYNITEAFRITGTLNLEHLTASFRDVLSRHEPLRTTFSSNKGKPVQWVHSCEDWELLQLDLSRLPNSRAIDRELEAILASEVLHPFDLEHGPLFRATLIALDHSRSKHVLAVNVHHIVADGWSMPLLLRELGMAYDRRVRNDPGLTEKSDFSYRHYVEWQQDWIRGDEAGRQLDFWLNELEGAPSLVELSVSKPRPPLPSFRGSCVERRIDPEVLRRLTRMSASRKGTAFMSLVTAYFLLLAGLSGRRDLLIGSTVAGRNLMETESLIGFFVNMILLRAPIQGDETFEELLERVREKSIDAFSNQETPFDLIVEELSPHRDPSFTPFLQYGFSMLNYKEYPLKLDGLEVTSIPVPRRHSIFDLCMFYEEKSSNLMMEFNLDLYSQEAAHEIFNKYLQLLEYASLDSRKTIAEMLQVVCPGNVWLQSDAVAVRSASAPSGQTPNTMTCGQADADLEEVVREIWCEVLMLRELGVEEHFFDLGGHSLLITQILSRVEETFGVKLPMKTLFDAPTVRQLSMKIQESLKVPAA
jgi:acyl carrier protein